MKQMTLDDNTTILEAAEKVAENNPDSAETSQTEVAPKPKGDTSRKEKKESPKQEKESPYVQKESGTKRFGISSLSTGDKALFDVSQVKRVSRYTYVHDIHVQNPVVLEERYWAILQNHTHVILVITEEVFEWLKSKGIPSLYCYCSVNEQPYMRQYVMENDDKWPSKKQIDEMDNYMDTWPANGDWNPRQEFKKKEKAAKEIARKLAAEKREAEKRKHKTVDEDSDEEAEAEGVFKHNDDEEQEVE